MTDAHETPDHGSADASKPTGATALLDSLRDALDDLTERATPTVREVSARAADLTATAAAKAAPFARRAGEATADASGKLAERSRSWAAELRASIGSEPAATAATAATTATEAASDVGEATTEALVEATDAIETTPAPAAEESAN